MMVAAETRRVADVTLRGGDSSILSMPPASMGG
jgi:hypothetical protein